MNALSTRAGRALILLVLLTFLAGNWTTGDAGAATPTAEPTIARTTEGRCEPSGTSSSLTGPLHTCGPYIVNVANRIVRPVAVNVKPLGRGAGLSSRCGTWEPVTPETATRVADWGFNSVLLFITWADLEPIPPTRHDGGGWIHHWNLEYLGALDRAIALFRARGVKVILMMHQSRWSAAFMNLKLPDGRIQGCGRGMPTWLYPNGGGIRSMVQAERAFFADENGVQAQFVTAWRKVAARYRTEPTVIGSIVLNEPYDLLAQEYPGTGDLTRWDLALARFYERVGRAIHQADPKLLLFLPEHVTFAGDVKVFALSRRPRVANAVQTFEFYSGNWIPSGRRKIEAYYQRARAWGMPSWSLEFSAFNATRTDVEPAPDWREHTRGFLTYTQSRGIGWSFLDYAYLPHPPVLRVLQSGI